MNLATLLSRKKQKKATKVVLSGVKCGQEDYFRLGDQEKILNNSPSNFNIKYHMRGYYKISSKYLIFEPHQVLRF